MASWFKTWARVELGASNCDFQGAWCPHVLKSQLVPHVLKWIASSQDFNRIQHDSTHFALSMFKVQYPLLPNIKPRNTKTDVPDSLGWPRRKTCRSSSGSTNVSLVRPGAKKGSDFCTKFTGRVAGISWDIASNMILWWKMIDLQYILWMEEILHQLIDGWSHSIGFQPSKATAMRCRQKIGIAFKAWDGSWRFQLSRLLDVCNSQLFKDDCPAKNTIFSSGVSPFVIAGGDTVFLNCWWSWFCYVLLESILAQHQQLSCRMFWIVSMNTIYLLSWFVIYYFSKTGTWALMFPSSWTCLYWWYLAFIYQALDHEPGFRVGQIGTSENWTVSWTTVSWTPSSKQK